MAILTGLACLPAFATVFTVTTSNDVVNPNDGLCSLREAIIAVNTATASGPVAGECPAGTGADVIMLPSGTYTLTIPPSGADDATTGDLNLTRSVTINGVGNPVVQAGGSFSDRVFNVGSGTTVLLSGFTVSGGHLNVSLGVDGGGGIRSDGTLTLTNMTISNNVVTQSGSALGPGGGIFSGSGTLTVTNSTISGNSAEDNGGGIYSQGTVTISNSTISGNAGNGLFSSVGGALVFLSAPGSTLTITNSTIANNTGGAGVGDAAGLDIEANGGVTRTATLVNVTISGNSNTTAGGLSAFGNQLTVTLVDTLVAGNSASASPDCRSNSGGTLLSGGNNLIGNNGGCTLTNVQGSDHIGTPASPINPLLGPLANNGGATNTMALLAGSPAIDAGNDSTCAPTDQRGFVRPAGLHCDIGAFEFGATSGVAAMFTDGPPPNGSLGVPYSFIYTASGTTPITFTVTSGAVPNGLTLSTSGVLSGTPTATGTFVGTVTASNGTLPYATQNFSIVIAAAPPPSSNIPVPMLSETALGMLALLLGVVGIASLRRRSGR